MFFSGFCLILSYIFECLNVKTNCLRQVFHLCGINTVVYKRCECTVELFLHRTFFPDQHISPAFMYIPPPHAWVVPSHALRALSLELNDLQALFWPKRGLHSLTPQLFSDPATNPSQSLSKSPLDKTTALLDVYFLTVPQAYINMWACENTVWPNKVWQREMCWITRKVTQCETSSLDVWLYYFFFVSSPRLLLMAVRHYGHL